MGGEGSTALALTEPAQGAGSPDGSLGAGRALVEAITAKDRDSIVAALAPAVRFRALLPKGPREVWGAAETADVFLGWFGGVRSLQVQTLQVEPIADRTSVKYRFRLRRDSGWEVIEQQQFLDMDEMGRIAAIDLLCSGFRPDMESGSGKRPGVHRFDAGAMGCGDGLAREFRRRILAIPLGDVLEVETIDPAAKADLPPLARMMGHTVLSVEAADNGRLLIKVERGR